MTNEIVINASVGETRVGIIERNLFTELHIERGDERNVAGTVVKGRVTRVLPGMQAAFVDIGLEKAAFLYAGDYYDNSIQGNGNGEAPERGRGRSRNGSRQPPPSIDTLLREGQEIVVQVAKEPIGSKGARITSHISMDHLPHFDRGSPSGGHAAFESGGRVTSHRVRSRAAPTPRDRFAKSAGRSGLHHPNGRRQRERSGSGSRHPLSDGGLERHPEEERNRECPVRSLLGTLPATTGDSRLRKRQDQAHRDRRPARLR